MNDREAFEAAAKLTVDCSDQFQRGFYHGWEAAIAHRGRQPNQPDAAKLVEALKGMVAIQDEPFKLQGLYGKAMDAAIEAQCKKVEQRVAVARAALANHGASS